MIPLLPVEVYIEILYCLPVSRNDSSEFTLLSFLQASSITRAAALTSGVWELPYRVRYTHSDEEREKERKAKFGGDWRLMYFERRYLESVAFALLDEIRQDRCGRQERAQMFTQGFSYDVWDALQIEAALPVPEWFSDSESEASATRKVAPAQALPRRYWATTVMGTIARYHVMKLWARAVNPETAHTVSFEEAMASFAAFFDSSPIQVLNDLEEICVMCRKRLEAQGVALDPNERGYNFWHLINKIRDVVREVGFRLAEGPHFYILMNQFPHFFLQPAHRETIPMSLVYVFIAVARRLGIQASPTNFPGVLHAHIQPPDPSELPKLLDMRGNEPPRDLPTAADLPPAMPIIPQEYTRPASAASMLSRAANNLVMFMRYERTYGQALGSSSSIDAHEAAFYAMSCWVLIDMQAEQVVPTPPESKALDTLAVLMDGICPALDPEPRRTVNARCKKLLEMEESQARDVSRRSMYPNVKHFVGLVFEHARYNYVGCIYGWDPICTQTKAWMEEMNVDTLPHGRNQPFYHVLTADGHPRYVAEDNIVPSAPKKASLLSLFKSRTAFSRYFADVEMHEETGLGRLVPSKELQDEYPEDEVFGVNWIHALD